MCGAAGQLQSVAMQNSDIRVVLSVLVAIIKWRLGEQTIRATRRLCVFG